VILLNNEMLMFETKTPLKLAPSISTFMLNHLSIAVPQKSSTNL
jgi:hypothetical protein